MQVIVTSQPDLLVSVEECKVALGESGNDRDSLIESFLWAAQGELDGPKGWVGISVAQQGIEAHFDSFDAVPVTLPGGPIIGDVVVTYLSGSGSTEVLDAGSYVVAPNGAFTLAAGASWPTLADQAGVCIASYTVGMVLGEDDSRIGLMKTAIILHVRMTMDGIEPEKSRRAIEALVRPLWVPVM